jgi:hypothetical protein
LEGKDGEQAGNVGIEQWIWDKKWELWKHLSWDRWQEWWTTWDSWNWKKASEETNSINFTYNMFSDIYNLSHVCSKILKLIHKITFFCADMFHSAGLSCIQNHLPFG